MLNVFKQSQTNFYAVLYESFIFHTKQIAHKLTEESKSAPNKQEVGTNTSHMAKKVKKCRQAYTHQLINLAAQF